jgi:hypothetical protein
MGVATTYRVPDLSDALGSFIGKVEGIFDNLDLRFIMGHGDSGDIKACADIAASRVFKVVQGNHGNFALFMGRDRCFGISELPGSPGFHFHEHEGILILGDNVDFPEFSAVIPFDYPVSVFLKIPGCNGFTLFAYGLFLMGHTGFKVPFFGLLATQGKQGSGFKVARCALRVARSDLLTAQLVTRNP